MGNKKLQMLSMILSGIGMIAGLIGGIVDDQKMKAEIADQVSEQLSAAGIETKKEES